MDSKIRLPITNWGCFDVDVSHLELSIDDATIRKIKQAKDFIPNLKGLDFRSITLGGNSIDFVMFDEENEVDDDDDIHGFYRGDSQIIIREESVMFIIMGQHDYELTLECKLTFI
jgi:hypothetical protein